MSDWLDKFHDANRATSVCIDQLIILARAFLRTGNVHVAEELYAISEQLEEARKDQQDAVGTSINESFASSQKMTGELVGAMFSLAASGALEHHAKHSVKVSP